MVCQTADGEQAVLKAKELQPDLVLLDISLPGMSGIEAAKRIEQLAQFAHHLPEPARFAASGGKRNAHGRPRIRCENRCRIGAPECHPHREYGESSASASCPRAGRWIGPAVPTIGRFGTRDFPLACSRPRVTPSRQPARCRRYLYFSNNLNVNPTVKPKGYPGVPCTRNLASAVGLTLDSK